MSTRECTIYGTLYIVQHNDIHSSSAIHMLSILYLAKSEQQKSYICMYCEQPFVNEVPYDTCQVYEGHMTLYSRFQTLIQFSSPTWYLRTGNNTVFIKRTTFQSLKPYTCDNTDASPSQKPPMLTIICVQIKEYFKVLHVVFFKRHQKTGSG